MKTAIVIPVGEGRFNNLLACLRSINRLEGWHGPIVLVGDGEEAAAEAREAQAMAPLGLTINVVEALKHHPGLDQPRNLGVRHVERLSAFADHPRHAYTHVWFIDSDVILAPDAYEAFTGMENFGAYGGIMLGPYDFMPPGHEKPMPEYRQDVRWASFERHDQESMREDLSAGLACFGGNLIWPILDFKRIGGFWNELHHGRCEDGELGLRAVACGMEIAFVAGARGWHIYHGGMPAPTPEWSGWAMGINAIDVPKINDRHHWLHGEQVFVVEEDGKRFNITCACGWSGNTAEIWDHLSYCVQA